MTNNSKSDILTLAHIQELQQICLFEKAQSEELRNETKDLRDIVIGLQTNLKQETMRSDLAVETVMQSSNPNRVVGSVSSWLRMAGLIGVEVACCSKISGRWVVVDVRKSSSIAGLILNDYCSHFSVDGREDSCSAYDLPSQIISTLGFSSHSEGIVIPILPTFFWVACGDQISATRDELLRQISLLGTATKLVMSALIKQLEESEMKLQLISLRAVKDVSNLLIGANLDHDGGSSSRIACRLNAWRHLPGILYNAWHSAKNVLGPSPSDSSLGDNLFSVDIVRIYSPSDLISWTIPLVAVSALSGSLIWLQPDGPEMAAMETKTALLHKSSDVSDQDRDEVVVIPIFENNEMETETTNFHCCLGCIVFKKKSQKNTSVSSSSHGKHIIPLSDLGNLPDTGSNIFSAEECTHVMSISSACLPSLSKWLTLYEINELFFPTKTNNGLHDRLSSFDSFHDAFDGYINSSNNSSGIFLKRLCGSDDIVDESTMNQDVSAVERKSLTRDIADLVGCSWATALAIQHPIREKNEATSDDVLSYLNSNICCLNDNGDLVPSINVDGLNRYASNESEIFISNSNPEEDRFLKVLQLSLLSRNSEKDHVLHLFENMDISKIPLLRMILSKTCFDSIRYTGYWSIAMMIVPVTQPLPRRSYNSSNSLILISGKQWHPRRFWQNMDGIHSMCNLLIPKLRTMLSIIVEHKSMKTIVDDMVPSQQLQIQQFEINQSVQLKCDSVIELLKTRLNILYNSELAVCQIAGYIRSQLWHIIADLFPSVVSAIQLSRDSRSDVSGNLSCVFELWMTDVICDKKWFLNPSAGGAWSESPIVSDEIASKLSFYVDIEIYRGSSFSIFNWRNNDKCSYNSMFLRIYDSPYFSVRSRDLMTSTPIYSLDDCNNGFDTNILSDFICELRRVFPFFSLKYSEIVLQYILFSIPAQKPTDFQSLNSSPNKNYITSTGFGLNISSAINRQNENFASPMPESDSSLAVELAYEVNKSAAFAMTVASDCVSTLNEDLNDEATRISNRTLSTHSIRSQIINTPNSLWRKHRLAGASYLGSATFWDRLLAAFTSPQPENWTGRASTSIAPLAVFAHGISDDVRFDTYDLLSGDLFDNSNAALGFVVGADGKIRKSSNNLTDNDDCIPTDVISAVISILRGPKTVTPGVKYLNGGGIGFLSDHESMMFSRYLVARSRAVDEGTFKLPSKSALSHDDGVTALIFRNDVDPMSVHVGQQKGSNTPKCSVSYAVLVHISSISAISPDFFYHLLNSVVVALQPLQYIEPVFQLQTSQRNLFSLHTARSAYDTQLEALLPISISSDYTDQISTNNIEDNDKAFKKVMDSLSHSVQQTIIACATACIDSAARTEVISANTLSSYFPGDQTGVYGEIFILKEPDVLSKVGTIGISGLECRSGIPANAILPNTLSILDPAVSTPVTISLSSLMNYDENIEDFFDSSSNINRLIDIGIVDVPLWLEDKLLNSPSKQHEKKQSNDSRTVLRFSFSLPVHYLSSMFGELKNDFDITSQSLSSIFCVVFINAPNCCSVLSKTLLPRRADNFRTALSKEYDRFIVYLSWICSISAFQILALSQQSHAFAQHHYRYQHAIGYGVEIIKVHREWAFKVMNEFKTLSQSGDTDLNFAQDSLTEKCIGEKLFSNNRSAIMVDFEGLNLSQIEVQQNLESLQSRIKKLVEENADFSYRLLQTEDKLRIKDETECSNNNLISRFLEELIPILMQVQTQINQSSSSVKDRQSNSHLLDYESLLSSLRSTDGWLSKDIFESEIPMSLNVALDLSRLNVSFINELVDIVCDHDLAQIVSTKLCEALAQETAKISHSGTDGSSSFMTSSASVLWPKQLEYFAASNTSESNTSQEEKINGSGWLYCGEASLPLEVRYPTMLQRSIATGACVVVDGESAISSFNSLEEQSRYTSLNSQSLRYSTVETMNPDENDAFNFVKDRTIYVPLIAERKTLEDRNLSPHKHKEIVSNEVIAAVIEYIDSKSISLEETKKKTRKLFLRDKFENFIMQIVRRLKIQTTAEISVTENISRAIANGTVFEGPENNRVKISMSFLKSLGQSKFSSAVELLSLIESVSPSICNDVMWEKLAHHSSNLAAGLFRCSAVIFLPKKSIANSLGQSFGESYSELSGAVHRYMAMQSTVRKDDSKISISSEKLLEVLRYKSLDFLGRNYESYGALGADECIINYKYLPDQLYGPSVLTTLIHMNDGRGNAERNLFYRVLIPIHFPKDLFSSEPAHESVIKASTSVGYLYIERQSQFEHQEMLSLWSIAKQVSFLATDYWNKVSLKSARNDITELSKKINHLEYSLEKQTSAVINLNLLQDFMNHTSELKSVFRQQFLRADNCSSDTLDSALTALKDVVDSESSIILGSSSVRLMHITSNMLEVGRGTIHMPLLADVLQLDTSNYFNNFPGIMQESMDQERTQLICQSKISLHFNSYVLPINDSHRLGTQHAALLAHMILAQNCQENTTVLDNKTESTTVVALHCLNGLTDEPRGPLCILAFKTNQDYSQFLRVSAFGGLAKSQFTDKIQNSGIWVLLVSFKDIVSWREFVGYSSDLEDTNKVSKKVYSFGLYRAMTLIGDIGETLNAVYSAYSSAISNSNSRIVSDTRQFLIQACNSISRSRNSGLISDISTLSSAVFFAFSNLRSDFYNRMPIKRMQLAERANDFSDAIRDYVYESIDGNRAFEFIDSHKNRVLFSRLFWKNGSCESASQGLFVQNWRSNNISTSSEMSNRDFHSITDYLLQGLNDNKSSEPEIFGSGFQNVLNKLTSSGQSQACILVKKLINNPFKDSNLAVQNKWDLQGPKDSPSNYCLLAVYIPLLKENFDSEDKVSGTNFQPAVLELHIFISSSCPLALVSTTGASVGANEYHPVPEDILKSDFVGQLFLIRDNLLSEYKSILISQNLKHALSSEEDKAQSTLSCLNILKSCLNELHAEGSSIVNILKSTETVLLTLPAINALKLKVCVVSPGTAAKQRNDDNDDFQSPSSTGKSFLNLRPNTGEINSVGRSSSQLKDFQSSDLFGEPFSSGPLSTSKIKIKTVLYESEESGAVDTLSETSGIRYKKSFSFQCYEVCGQISLSLSHQTEAYDLAEIFDSFSKVLGRRCYELYRGQRNKKQLVHEQKLNHQLTGQVSSLKELVSRRDVELANLTKTKGELELQLGNIDVDNTRLRDALRVEQQAHHTILSEKKDVIKQNKRAMEEIRSENDRKERELRKRIQELSKGVQIGDREFESAKLDLEKMTAKAAKLEGKRLQITQDFDLYRMQCEDRLRNQEGVISSLQDERRELNSKIAVYEERISNNVVSFDEKYHGMVTKLKSVDEELVASKSISVGLRRQLDSATKSAKEARDELENMKTSTKSIIDDYKKRLGAAEVLIKQLYEHKHQTSAGVPLVRSLSTSSVRISNETEQNNA